MNEPQSTGSPNPEPAPNFGTPLATSPAAQPQETPDSMDESEAGSTISVRTDRATPGSGGGFSPLDDGEDEAPGVAPLQEGERLGPYEVREHIGDGGMASVYKAWHTGLHRFEALKVPRHQHTYGPEANFLRRLLAEARTSARLRHPHIVAIHNVSEPDAALQYFSMEFVSGCDLARLLESRGRLTVEEAFPILYQVASGLDYAHSQGVVHRDIKPANILLAKERRATRRLETKEDKAASENEQDEKPAVDETLAKLPFHGHWHAKVVDFGISRAGEDTGGTRLTRSGMIVGTPEYMSPEQSGSGEPVTFRTDIYSLAVVAYEVLCGTPPFTAGDGVSRISILVKHVGAPPPSPQSYFPGLPDIASEVLLQGLAKKPEDRFDTCVDFVKSLAMAMVDTENVPFTAITGERQYAASNTAVLNTPAATLLGISPEVAVPAAAPESKDPRRSTLLAGLGGLMIGAAIVFGWIGNENQTIVRKPMNAPAKAAVVIPVQKKAPVLLPKPVAAKPVPPALRTVTVERLRPIAFAKQVQASPALFKGQTKIAQVGKNGEQEVQLRLTYRGAKEVERKVVGTRVVRAAVNQVELHGTKVKVAPRPAPVKVGPLKPAVKAEHKAAAPKAVRKPVRAKHAVKHRTSSRPRAKARRYRAVRRRSYGGDAPLPP